MSLDTFRQSRWYSLVWIVPALIGAAAIIVALAMWLRLQPDVQSFMADYPGRSELPEGATEGFPAWLAWQHFFNSFFILFVIRSGWQIRTTKRPAAYWTRNNTGLLRTKGEPQRISIHQWFHISINALWLLNGLVLYVLLFSTNQWMRIVPVSWDIFPNAVSAGLQYASLNWPVEMGWVNYNALQTLAYFVTVFVAAPLAVLTGLRMTPGLAARWKPLERVFPVQLARLLHFPIMVYFVLFIIVHVALVLLTGALNNLNHMYAIRDDQSWWGFGLFVASLVVMAVAWVAAKPSILAMIAGLSGKVRR
ncbi:MAG: cytochrome b/b6 domain-containing protein [Cryobacterium sp.]|nr:cytochrome b/b6 domain-containing protein [Micrococcales bacterium]MBX3079649.1 cytochrome b/b6 domain-containing protein [Cryobacterium sp.]MBX3311208.1 cytochrome b/b6 domain-containing protein [Cryobacterium sp.]